MYDYLKGTLIKANPTFVVLEIGGIGYQLWIPHRQYGTLPEIGQQALFYTSFVIREFSQTLYGFLYEHERDVYEILLNITGVGPKLALSLIGHLSLNDLHQAIMNHDLGTLCKVPGVGKKTAERLLVELKDKLTHFISTDSSLESNSMTLPQQSQKIQDAMRALINLGYHQNTAQKAIKQTLKDCSDEIDLALLITEALKRV